MVLTVMMAWGRLGALTVVIAIAQNPYEAQLVQYPEEQILIG
jgi:trk system potassium uptake protein TrkH